MAGNLLIRRAHVVDGSGVAGRTADVEVRDGRITRVGQGLRDVGSGGRVIDADGLVLAPGFIDVHTHYDAQLFFDPAASPSSAHGVTTVVTGNCGFTFAPAVGEGDLEWLVHMLGKVEGMSVDSIRAGVDWTGGSFGSFLDRLSGRTAVNMCAFVGHAAVRRGVMGAAASERTATPDEIAGMQQLVREAMAAGAFGFSSSQLDVHADHAGNPVPPNLAAPEEVVALAAVLAEFDRGVLQFAPRSSGMPYSDEDRSIMLGMVRASGGKPANLGGLMSRPPNVDSWRPNLAFYEEAAREGLPVHPMAFSNPARGMHFTFTDTLVFDEMPAMRAMMALPLPERKRCLADPRARDRFKDEYATVHRIIDGSYETARVATVSDPANEHLRGRNVAEVATETGVHPMDLMIDLALAEDLRTVFVYERPAQDDAVLSHLLHHPLVMVGASDGGAHLTSFCGADFTTRLLTEVVDSGAITFEAAVNKITLQPATAHGLWDRGAIRPGAVADLVLLDRAELGVKPIHFVEDLPAGASRLVWDQQGYVATIVAGEVIVEAGAPTGSTPGEVVRPNRS